MKKIQDLIRAELEKGIKKTFLARKMGIPAASLFNYVYGNVEPRPESLKKIAQYFDKPISYFLEDTPGDMTSEEQHVLKLYRTVRTMSKERADDIVRYLEFTLLRMREADSSGQHSEGY